MFEKNDKRREAVKKLVSFIESQDDGARLSFVEIETATGIVMDDTGRGWLREAADRAQREYLAIPGSGIELSSADNGLTIVNKGERGFLNKLRAVRKTIDRIDGRHSEQMNSEQRHALNHHKAIFGTLSLQATLAKPLPKLGAKT